MTDTHVLKLRSIPSLPPITSQVSSVSPLLKIRSNALTTAHPCRKVCRQSGSSSETTSADALPCATIQTTLLRAADETIRCSAGFSLSTVYCPLPRSNFTYRKTSATNEIRAFAEGDRCEVNYGQGSSTKKHQNHPQTARNRYMRRL